MITRRGIYHDIEEATFIYNIDNFTLYFSSEFNKNRFITRYDEYSRKLSKSLNKIYNIDYTKIIILSLYKLLEKRGFKVYYKDNRITKESLRLEV